MYDLKTLRQAAQEACDEAFDRAGGFDEPINGEILVVSRQNVVLTRRGLRYIGSILRKPTLGVTK